MEPNASQLAVFLLFGRCLMRLQQYELLMKRLIAAGSMTTSVSGAMPQQTKYSRSLPTSTLGLLAGEFFRSVVVAEGGSRDTNPSAGIADQGGIVITTTLRIEMTAENHEAARQRVAELVELRNTLVHHFIELFDLMSEPGCDQAMRYLEAARERVGSNLDELKRWASSMNESRLQAMQILRSDAFVDLFENGIDPDGVVDWERAGIVDCLAEAAEHLGRGDWAPLLDAIAFIAERHPDQTPQKYQCRSWPQVIHESKRFDLEYTVEPGAAKVARFRARKVRDRRVG